MFRSLVVAASFLVSLSAFAQGSAAPAAEISSPPEVSPWTHESELGIAMIAGNTKSETYNAKQATTYQWDENKIKLSARYLNTNAEDTETARNWESALRYDRVLNPKVSIFAAHVIESDVFSGYVQRNNYDLGGRYDIAKSTASTWFAELGYRNSFTQFVSTPAPDVKTTAHILRAYTETTLAIGDQSSFKFWVEYLPSLSAGDDYRINAEPSITSQLNGIFALKVGYLTKYQQTVVAPATVQADRFFTTSLFAKF